MDTKPAAVRQQSSSRVIIFVFVNQGLVNGSVARLRGATGHTDINRLFIVVMCSSSVKAKHSEVYTEIDQHTT